MHQRGNHHRGHNRQWQTRNKWRGEQHQRKEAERGDRPGQAASRTGGFARRAGRETGSDRHALRQGRSDIGKAQRAELAVGLGRVAVA